MRLSESNTSVRQLFLIIMIIIIIMVMVMTKLMMTLMMMSERSNSVRLMYRAAVSRLLLLVNHHPVPLDGNKIFPRILFSANSEARILAPVYHLLFVARGGGRERMHVEKSSR